jgi:hypothetical protein
MTYVPKNIDCKKIKPHMAELILRCGSPEIAADYAGIGTSTMYRIIHDHHCTVQMRTAQLILDGLQRKRVEDRRNGLVHPSMVKQAHLVARREREFDE